MKRVIITITAALALLAASVSSCTKQEPVEPNVPQETVEPAADPAALVPVTFIASGEPMVRSYIDDSGSPLTILWESTDKVAIYDDVAPSDLHIFSVAPGSPATGATLSGEVSSGATEYYAISPAEAAVGLSGNTITASVPENQVIPSGKNIDPSALVSVAYTVKGGNLSFKNICGFLAVEVSYANVKKITIEGSKIAGSVTVDGATGVIAGNESATNSIELTYEGNVAFPVGKYYIAILPGTTDALGFTVKMEQDIEGFSATRTASSAVTIPRNGGFNFGALDTKLSWTYIISSAADLVAWNERSAEWEITDIVRLANNIDCASISDWTPHDFPGTFDGQGHSIYNLVVEKTSSTGASFILYNYGTIQNLTIGSSDGTTYDGVSKFQATLASGTAHIGPVYDNRGTIQDVTNFASVISAGPSQLNMGGIAAHATTAGASFVRCYNHGAVVLTAAPTVSYINIGGVLGHADNLVTMSYCDNCADASVGFNFEGSQSKEVRIGGVFGCIEKNADATVVNCNNYQDILFENCTIVNNCHLKVGGVGGMFSGIMDYCINYGDITFAETVSAVTNERIYWGGVVGHAPQVSADSGPQFSYCSNNGKLTSFVNTAHRMGGVVGMTQTSSFDHCDNNGAISLTSTANFQLMGGVVGMADAAGTGQSSTITYCKNTGSIELTKTGTATHDAMIIGGIAGRLNGAEGSEISNSENNGSISITSSKTATAGGILGHTWNNSSKFELKNNTNTGDITVQGDSYGYAGGIVGWGRNSINTVTNCTSTGSIAANTGAGALLGRNASATVYFSFTGCKVKGAVNGTVLTADNFESYLAGSDPAGAISGTTFIAD